MAVSRTLSCRSHIIVPLTLDVGIDAVSPSLTPAVEARDWLGCSSPQDSSELFSELCLSFALCYPSPYLDQIIAELFLHRF